MPDKCPQDGGFIGASGCTHPNHQHGETVKRLLDAAKNPRPITAEECEAALREGFYVQTRWGTRVGFGQHLLDHIDDHSMGDAESRKEKLLFAIKTVRSGKRTANPKGGPGSYSYAMRFEEFGMLVHTDKHGTIEDVFTFYDEPKKATGRRK